MPKIVGMRRLVSNGITHTTHNEDIHDGVTLQVTACGIEFVGYYLPDEGTESSLYCMFHTVDPPGSIVLLRGTFEDRLVDCMTCLIGMRTWNQT